MDQVADYLLALGQQDKFADGRLDGVLVAERIPPAVRTLSEAEGVATYEIGWPLNLKRVV